MEDLDCIAAAALPWEELAGTTLLITGANGFLPAYMVESALRLNELRGGRPVRVVGLVRSLERAKKRFAEYSGRDDLRLVEHDVGLPWQADCPVDWIIHAASAASPKFYLPDPVGTLAPNVIGTDHLLSLARRAQSRGFLLFSSSEVYGPVPARIPTGEDDYGPVDPLNARSCYAEGKRAAESLCFAWFTQHGIPASIVRPFHTYGPGMSLEDGRVFADFVRDICQRRNLRLNSAGTDTRAFTYLADATVAYWTVLLRGRRGTAYNVANDEGELAIVELARLLVSLFPERNLQVETFFPGGPQSPEVRKLVRSAPDVFRLRSLGWQPRTSVADGFLRTVRYFECK